MSSTISAQLRLWWNGVLQYCRAGSPLRIVNDGTVAGRGPRFKRLFWNPAKKVVLYDFPEKPIQILTIASNY